MLLQSLEHPSLARADGGKFQNLKVGLYTCKLRFSFCVLCLFSEHNSSKEVHIVVRGTPSVEFANFSTPHLPKPFHHLFWMSPGPSAKLLRETLKRKTEVRSCRNRRAHEIFWKVEWPGISLFPDLDSSGQDWGCVHLFQSPSRSTLRSKTLFDVCDPAKQQLHRFCLCWVGRRTDFLLPQSLLPIGTVLFWQFLKK